MSNYYPFRTQVPEWCNHYLNQISLLVSISGVRVVFPPVPPFSTTDACVPRSNIGATGANILRVESTWANCSMQIWSFVAWGKGCVGGVGREPLYSPSIRVSEWELEG